MSAPSYVEVKALPYAPLLQNAVPRLSHVAVQPELGSLLWTGMDGGLDEACRKFVVLQA